MYNLALVIHIIAVLALFGAIGMVHAALGRMRKADTTASVAEQARRGALGAWATIVLTVVAFIPAAYMVNKKFTFQDGWVNATLVALVVTILLALIVVGPRLLSLARAAGGDGPSAPSLALQRRSSDPLVWGAATVIATLYIGIVVLMFGKPSGLVSAIILIVAALIGIGGTMPARARYQKLSESSPQVR